MRLKSSMSIMMPTALRSLRVAVEIGIYGGIKALAVVEAGQDVGVGQLAQVAAAVLQCDEHMRQEGQDEDEQ